MAYNSRELRAINYIQEKNNWKVQMSTRLVIYFKDESGKEVKMLLQEVLNQYDEGRKDDSKNKKKNNESPFETKNISRYFKN